MNERDEVRTADLADGRPGDTAGPDPIDHEAGPETRDDPVRDSSARDKLAQGPAATVHREDTTGWGGDPAREQDRPEVTSPRTPTAPDGDAAVGATAGGRAGRRPHRRADAAPGRQLRRRARQAGAPVGPRRRGLHRQPAQRLPALPFVLRAAPRNLRRSPAHRRSGSTRCRIAWFVPDRLPDAAFRRAGPAAPLPRRGTARPGDPTLPSPPRRPATAPSWRHELLGAHVPRVKASEKGTAAQNSASPRAKRSA